MYVVDDYECKHVVLYLKGAPESYKVVTDGALVGR